MKERIAIIDGLRTPMGRMGGGMAAIPADMLASSVARELLTIHSDLTPLISEVITGNVAQPANAANISRVIALRAGIDQSVTAYTVHRNCASGMEAVTSGICKILAGQAETVLAIGCESMSNIPLLFHPTMKDFLENIMRSKTVPQKLKALLAFRLKMLQPIIGLKLGLTDPICNMIMGNTAEVLARDFGISREAQDKFAMLSHNKAEKALKNNILAEEIHPIYNPKTKKIIKNDEGIRAGQNMTALSKLRPFFDRKNGTVTAGNSSQITDGAAAVIIMSEKKAKSLGLKPLGFVRGFAYAGLEPKRMGLGPVFATHKLLKQSKLTLKDIDLFEVNEAFAVQAMACQKAFASKEFAKQHLGEEQAMGEVLDDKLNVNGGAVALGHPVGMTGTRIIIHLLKELNRRKLRRGVATLCIGGGQGGATLLETI